MAKMGVRPLGSIRPAAAGLLVMVLSLAAALSAMAFLAPANALLPHSPPGLWLRAPLAVAWAGLQVIALVAVFTAPPLGFGVACFWMVAGGGVVMSIGRAGIAGLSWVSIGTAVPSAFMALAIALWLMYRNPAVTAATTAWRIFFWLCLTGGVYLFTAHPSESASHLLAIAVSIGVCGASAMLSPWMSRLVDGLDRIPRLRLSIFVWVLCALLLVVNGLVMRGTGTQIPQIQLAGFSVAPYFLAAGLMPFAVALDLGAATTRGWRAMVPSAVGLPIAALLYVGLLGESGTLAVVCLSVLTVVLLAGTPIQAGCAAVAVLVGNVTLQSPRVADLIANVAPRVGERLLVWSQLQAPPNQLVRVMEVMTSAGVLGHAGAARLRFLVGPEVAKDYMPALVLANGGWVGLALVGLGSFLFVAELYRVQKATSGVVGRAIQTAVLALVVGNLLATTLWIGGITPFVGVPLPVLARAGSHLVVLAALLVLFDAAAGVDGRSARETGHAR